MASATLIRLNKDEWQKLPAGHFYNGKYQVGPFTLTYEFIVKYMALIHKTEIPESWLTDNGTSLSDKRYRKRNSKNGEIPSGPITGLSHK